MKKSFSAGLVCLSAVMALALAACGTQTATPSASPSAMAESAAPTDSETPEASLFTAGTWLSDAGQYYFFDNDGTSGRTASLEDGTGVSFSYTLNGSEAVFSMGGEGNETKCTVTRDGDALTLAWDGGVSENLSYVSDKGSDEFTFYSNRDIADMALAYYRAHNSSGDGDNLTSAAETNADGSVSVQVYTNLGDHNSTAEWYTIDRNTATGTDSSGNEIDLKS